MYTIPQKRANDIKSEPTKNNNLNINHLNHTQLQINKVPNSLSSAFIQTQLEKIGKLVSYRENIIRSTNNQLIKKVYVTIAWLDDVTSKLAYSIIEKKMTIKLVYDSPHFWVIQEVV